MSFCHSQQSGKGEVGIHDQTLRIQTYDVAIADLVDGDDVTKSYIIDSMGRKQGTTIVNEIGLYSLIIGSRKKEAKTFKQWITREVLPSIVDVQQRGCVFARWQTTVT